MPHKAFAIWWILMRHKIPCRQQLFEQNIEEISDPNYALLPKSLTFSYLLQPSPPHSITVTNSAIDFYMIVECTLSAIWCAHFRFVLDDLEFVPNRVTALATLHIRKLEAELVLTLL
ncbi:hypothetical protein PHYBLDRAFT_152550 [Phycomyces blakesleeanus NRRL 1555(-)]|uniref:Uncharacterized protein n=1 Tax=Phycomyces blakesleeanus (strain ATCC 8743b / DSM 1359 / FGSC 10004 / NBRC 33097 / NRRL 1555) TaxID=763407 RepID=A0A162N7E2_PHYB8|nr:hypothetical protein PHYBLDRAFT_152550 [Phycomyces blakesleeanus NRRL 1555(-)]OAD66474.1 hypothetical protein PHYBLDRAFT_152550 [Phycomyces blakesleeanus NRRL 1555(-)]|eukprot:XP_018284514.1 hypothetical protein PHYBLDRAFT_152550 [Phycomyces blakesleeanus NRRL 1555(-)]